MIRHALILALSGCCITPASESWLGYQPDDTTPTVKPVLANAPDNEPNSETHPEAYAKWKARGPQ